MLNLIFCVDNSGLFGRNNQLPWNFKEDLKYFKDITTNFNRINDSENIIVMGYNTWISIKKKLPNRINVVISSKLKNESIANLKKNISIQNSNNTNEPDYIFSSFDTFMENCKKGKTFYNKNIFIIGGKKLFSYTILKYNKYIKNVFINTIQHSFPQFINDVVLKIYSFNNFELNRLSTNSIFCLNSVDGKYYDIKFSQYVNKNFNTTDVLIFTDNLIDNKIIKNQYQNENHDHDKYSILEEMHDVTLNYCEDCETIVKNEKSLCNDCISKKCKCLFC